MKEYQTYKDKQKYLLALRISALVASVFLVLTLAHLQSVLSSLLIMLTVFIVSVGSFLYTYQTKKFHFVYYGLSCCGIIMPILDILFVNSNTHYTDFIWIFCALLFAFVGTNLVWGISLSVVAFIGCSLFVLFSMNTNIEVVTPRNIIQKIALILEFLGSIFCTVYLSYVFINFYKKSENQLRAINSSLRVTNEKVTQQDEEKTVLVKEIHHRVKNNLQIITSLLRMQSYEITDLKSKTYFDEAINRIMAMSLVHQKLYQENTLARLELQNYLTELSKELIDIYNKSNWINTTIEANIKSIGLKSIVPIGLLLNELITNSLEHAFEKEQTGEINIQISETSSSYQIIYTDNGIWKEKEESRTGFGLELIELLTEQLEGSKEIKKTEYGTLYKFDLKNLDK